MREFNDDPECVCGVHRSEHLLLGCPDGFEPKLGEMLPVGGTHTTVDRYLLGQLIAASKDALEAGGIVCRLDPKGQLARSLVNLALALFLFDGSLGNIDPRWRFGAEAVDRE